MPLSDGDFLEWTRYKTPVGSDTITEQNVIEAGDVCLCQLMLYLMVRVTVAKCIVEVGCADGSTTLALLKAASETGGTVISVDPTPCLVAKELVERCGYSDIWKFYEMKSEEFWAEHAPDRVDFTFIDGDHCVAATTIDFTGALKRLPLYGVIASHDWHVMSEAEVAKHLLSCSPEMQEYEAEHPTAAGSMRGMARALAEYEHPLQWFQFHPYSLLTNEPNYVRADMPKRFNSEGGFMMMQRQPDHVHGGFNHFAYDHMIPLWHRVAEGFGK